MKKEVSVAVMRGEDTLFQMTDSAADEIGRHADSAASLFYSSVEDLRSRLEKEKKSVDASISLCGRKEMIVDELCHPSLCETTTEMHKRSEERPGWRYRYRYLQARRRRGRGEVGLSVSS